MVTGVLLGLLAPEAQAWLFPKTLAAGGPHPSMLILYALSQIGLVLYMFIVGMEFNHRLILGRVRHASLVSGAGIAVPMALGAIAALTLRGDADLFAPHVTPGAAALYLGAAMSITAFPTLARILHEKGIARTRLGTLALAAGSSGDAAAWCLLALVLSYLEGSWLIAILAIGGGGLYVAVMLLLGRPLLRVLDRGVDGRGRIAPGTLVGGLLVLMLGAFVTDVVGIYAVFGAFIAGIAMRVAVILVALSIVGKGVACLLAARVSGEAWRESVAIGVLMNARGLMELIILNIGLQHGIITPTLFTIMVLMAVVTTLMASPPFELVYGRRAAVAAQEEQPA